VPNRKWFDKVYQHEIVRQLHWKWVDTFFLLTGNGSTLFFCLLEMVRQPLVPASEVV
jgi:hypothetical protein